MQQSVTSVVHLMFTEVLTIFSTHLSTCLQYQVCRCIVNTACCCACLDNDKLQHMLQVRKLFQQLFSFVNVQLFNQLLLRRECCSFSNGEYVKTGLAEVENWIHTAGKDWTGESWDELRYIRQVGSGSGYSHLCTE